MVDCRLAIADMRFPDSNVAQKSGTSTRISPYSCTNLAHELYLNKAFWHDLGKSLLRQGVMTGVISLAGIYTPHFISREGI